MLTLEDLEQITPPKLFYIETDLDGNEKKTGPFRFLEACDMYHSDILARFRKGCRLEYTDGRIFNPDAFVRKVEMDTERSPIKAEITHVNTWYRRHSF